MKKLFTAITLFLTIVLCINVVSFAQEITLSLDDAINMAKKDNPKFIIADVKIKDAERQLQEAKRDQKDVKGAIRIPEMFSLAAVKKGYYVEQAKIGVEIAKREKQREEGTLSYEVTQKYYYLKLSEELVKCAKDTYNVALQNKSAVDKKFELGLVSSLDVSNAAYAVSQAKAMVNKYERDYDIAKQSLLVSLQIDDDTTKLILTDGIEFEEFSSDVKADIKNAMETRLDVYSLKSAYEQAKRYLDITVVLGYKSAEYSAANNTLVQSEYNYSNTKKLIGISINATYNDILNSKDSVLLAEENLELKKKEYEVAKAQYEIGMITNSQLVSVLNSVGNAQIELENAKLTYKLATKKYGYEITIGL